MLVVNEDHKLCGEYSRYYLYEVSLKTIDAFYKELERQNVLIAHKESLLRRLNMDKSVTCFIRKSGSDSAILDFFHGKTKYKTHIYKPNKKLKYNKPSLGGSTIQK